MNTSTDSSISKSSEGSIVMHLGHIINYRNSQISSIVDIWQIILVVHYWQQSASTIIGIMFIIGAGWMVVCLQRVSSDDSHHKSQCVHLQST